MEKGALSLLSVVGLCSSQDSIVLGLVGCDVLIQQGHTVELLATGRTTECRHWALSFLVMGIKIKLLLRGTVTVTGRVLFRAGKQKFQLLV